MAKKKGCGKKKGGGKKRMAGGSKIGDWFKGAANTVWNKAIKPAGNFIKDHHVLSTVAGMIPDGRAKIGATALRAIGLGKGGRPVRLTGYGRQQGGLNKLNGRLYLV